MFKPPQPRDKLALSLCMPDVHLISLHPSLEPCHASVGSRDRGDGESDFVSVVTLAYLRGVKNMKLITMGSLAVGLAIWGAISDRLG